MVHIEQINKELALDVEERQISDTVDKFEILQQTYDCATHVNCVGCPLIRQCFSHLFHNAQPPVVHWSDRLP